MSRSTAAGDRPLEIRPLRPDDEPLLLASHGNTTQEKLRPPRLGVAPILTREILAGLCRLDHPKDVGFVALARDEHGTPRLAGVSRCFFDPETGLAEVAVEVLASWQAQGVSDQLLRPLIAHARNQGIRKLVTGAQGPMIGIATRFGFLMTMETVGGDGPELTFKVIRDLDKGIDLRKFNPSSISQAEIRDLVSSMYRGPAFNEDIEGFFLEIDRAHAVQSLDGLLQDSDPRIRNHALELLVFLEGPQSLPRIEKCLNDSDIDVRCAVCSYLADTERPEAVTLLLRILRDDPAEFVRYAAVEALERCGDLSTIPALQATAKKDKGANYEGWPIKGRAREAIKEITRRNR